MDKLFLILLIVLFLIVGVVGYSSHTQNGNALANYNRGYSIAAVPAAPYTCDVNHLADFVYKDDTDDGVEATTCYCGLDNDDATPVWINADNPNNNCW